ncbi:Glycolipid transfer protein superfamily [Sesbania bispinosa]|nr:Glycolipid transfer protein superfamily [Sesbania bispinosa]
MAGEQKHKRKLADVLLTCFGATSCRKEQLQLAPDDENDTEKTRRRSISSTVVDDKPLQKIADAFKELANVITIENSDVDVAAFSRACSYVALLFGCLGLHFKFIEMDYVNDIAEASKSFKTLQSMVDHDGAL